ncbi:insulinase family protein [Aromatoleum toluvorans]|uniref:Insulinase family protein n=1 Tax=Aromatoleum toluvorans TaxID=92002 RepID=A0ABX1PZB1_9RHOO|nr:pitrilysin family protein [Aromatoleum toluvorans]NMG43580.1 insulinase family protein [Aromatoleum toluvorans]
MQTKPMTALRRLRPDCRPFRALLALAAVMIPLASLPAAAVGPDIKHWDAATGARVYFVESHALPLVDIQISFPAGSAYEPEGGSGIAGLTRGLLDAGTEGLDEQQIAERIADTGARIGGGADTDMATLSVRTLSSATERDAAIALAARLLAKPTFPADVLERERARAIAGLKESLTQPDTLASRRFMAMIYGSHPYGRSTTVESLQSITREQLQAFHRTHYTAGSAAVTIVGDVSRDEADAIARQLTEGLPAGAPPAPIPAPQLPARGTEHIAHPSAQAHILIGMPGMSRDDPDYFPLLVGNYVLGGGGFVSRLMKEVREKRGFAYSVSSYFLPLRVAGPFEIGLQTRGSQADDALKVSTDVLEDFIARGPTPTELKAARDNLVNGFGLRLDSNRKILDYVGMIAFYQLPLDWLETYPKKVAAVTVESVRDAFARRVKPANLVTVVAGGDGDTAVNGGGAKKAGRGN